CDRSESVPESDLFRFEPRTVRPLPTLGRYAFPVHPTLGFDRLAGARRRDALLLSRGGVGGDAGRDDNHDPRRRRVRRARFVDRLSDPRDRRRGVDLAIVARAPRAGACLARELKGGRERELRGLEPESLVGDLVRRVVHRVERVIAWEGRVVLAVSLDDRDGRNTGETKGRRVKDGCTARGELWEER